MIINLNAIALPVVLLLTVLLSGSAFMTHRSIQLPLHAFILFSALALSFRLRIPQHTFRNSVIVILIFCAVLGLQYLVFFPTQTLSQALYLLAKVIIAIVLVLHFTQVPAKESNRGMLFVLTVLAWHGMLAWAAYPFIVNHLQHFTDKLDTFAYLFFYRGDFLTGHGSFNLLGVSLIRNQGLMWEPGIFQYFMNAGLFLSLRPSGNPRRTVLFTIAILSTWSTLGYFLMLVIYLFYVLAVIKKTRYAALMIILFFFLCAMGVLAKHNIEAKLYGDQSISAELRILDLKANYQLFLASPLIGHGYDFDHYCEKLKACRIPTNISEVITDARRGVTNSIAVLGGQFGIFMPVLYLFGVYRQKMVSGTKGSLLRRNLFFGINFLTLVSLPLALMPWFMAFAVSGWIVREP